LVVGGVCGGVAVVAWVVVGEVIILAGGARVVGGVGGGLGYEVGGGW